MAFAVRPSSRRIRFRLLVVCFAPLQSSKRLSGVFRLSHSAPLQARKSQSEVMTAAGRQAAPNTRSVSCVHQSLILSVFSGSFKHMEWAIYLGLGCCGRTPQNPYLFDDCSDAFWRCLSAVLVERAIQKLCTDNVARVSAALCRSQLVGNFCDISTFQTRGKAQTPRTECSVICGEISACTSRMLNLW